MWSPLTGILAHAPRIASRKTSRARTCGTQWPVSSELKTLFTSATEAMRCHPSSLQPRCSGVVGTGAQDHVIPPHVLPRCAQGIRHPGSQPWGPCGTAPLFVCAQGIPCPVGHCWGPCRAGHLGLTHTETQRGTLWTLRTEVCGQQKRSNNPHNNQHNLNMPTTGRR